MKIFQFNVKGKCIRYKRVKGLSDGLCFLFGQISHCCQWCRCQSLGMCLVFSSHECYLLMTYEHAFIQDIRPEVTKHLVSLKSTSQLALMLHRLAWMILRVSRNE